MTSISVTEKDFEVLASAAVDAFERGDEQAAKAIDKVARKINAALSNQAARKAAGPWARGSSNLTWKDVPSTLERFITGRKK